MPLGRVPAVRGLVLAAGAGHRMGGPKALLRHDGDGLTLVEHAIEMLLEGGCNGVSVVVGAGGEEVRSIVEHTAHDVDLVRCPDWDLGMGSSLRAGLTALTTHSHEGNDQVEAVVVTLVDLPDVGAEVVTRLLETPPGTAPHWTRALRRAAYNGVAGHPVLIGRHHWKGAAATALGDRGARDYLRTHRHDLVECADLATGRDVDTPHDLRRLP